MAVRGDGYSRLVSWLKVILPLAALAILSTVFLVSRRYDPEASIPYSQVELDKLLRDQRISDPRYAGMTEDGAAIRIGAASATPDPEEPARLQTEDLSARIETPDGGWLDIAAGQGMLDQGGALARMAGAVHIVSSTGYDMRTEALTARLDATDIESDGAVEAEGPLGRLEAGAMTLRRVGGTGDYVLDFKDGVQLVYTPPEG